MKIKLPIAVLVLVLLAASCAPTMRFDQTCYTCIKSQRISGNPESGPKSQINGQDCMVTIVETGENIYLNDILKEEKITPVANIPLTIAKVNGKVYLTGNGFSKLWIICPKPGNEAKYKSIDFPIEKINIDEPIFNIDFESIRLKLSANNLGGKTYILLDDSEWILEKSGKAGE